MIAAAIELECAGSSCTHMWPCRRKRRGGKTELESRASSGLRTCSRDGKHTDRRSTDETAAAAACGAAAAVVSRLTIASDGESTGGPQWEIC